MKTMFAALLLFLSLSPGVADGQPGSPMPAALATAKTVAILNDTHVDAVSQGAVDALKAWGRFTVIDDPESADFTLRFDKSKDREGHDSQKPDDQGNTSYNYSLSFSSSIHMKAYLKDADTPFYTTRTDDSKKKAGIACVSDFRAASHLPR